MKNDEIVIELSESIRLLINSLSKDIQTKVLEINTNVESNKFFHELLSISNSLEQYRKKEVGLLYVGLLGSYSSGKSSSINSLLNLWNSKEMRKTSNNPTDVNITLITNESNVDNVFTFSKEGKIRIRTKTNFNLEFLNNIVIMDTPGSGDPNIIEEIVRDSLPLCDLILYTLNSTAPFTNIDSPFLEAQQDKLKNIPLIFLLTRGDEFRKSRYEELTEENFDIEKYENELGKIVNRINETIPHSHFTKEDFILIDNHSGFNVDKLRERVMNYSGDNSEVLQNLHIHKLQYYKRELKAIHEYFKSLTKSKIDKCKIVFKKAEDNSVYFDDQIDVSKIKLRSLCTNNIQIFSGIFGQAESGLQGILDELNLIRSFKESGDLLSFRQKTKKKIDEESLILAGKIIRELESKAQNETLNLKESILESIDYEKLSISSTKVFNYDFLYQVTFPFEKEKYIVEVLEIYNNKIQSDINKLKEQLINFKKYIQAKRPLDPTNENILKFRESLRDVMNVYYQALEMYNSAVFSYEVRTQVSELGLASEFDKLEVSGISRSKYNSITEKELSGAYDNFSDEFIIQVKPFVEEIPKLQDSIYKLKPNYSTDLKDFVMHSEINDYNDNEINSYITKIYKDLLENVQYQLQNLRKDILKLKKQRGAKYLAAIIIPFALFGISWVLVKFSDFSMPTSLIINLLIGILCSVIASLAIRAFDSFERNKKIKVEHFKTTISTAYNLKADELFSEFKKQNEGRQKSIADNIKKMWLAVEDEFLSDFSDSSIEIFHKDVIKKTDEFKVQINTYKGIVSGFGKKVLELFKRDDIYLIKIEEVAKTIKHDSIEPSTKLLNNTFSEIELVQEQIEKISY